MRGSEVIAGYLVQQKVPFVFGICGHGNVGMLDALYDVRDKVTLCRHGTNNAPGTWPTPTSA